MQIDDRLKFNILLSNTPNLAQISKPKRADLEVPRLKNVTSLLMKDISTMNMAFTFGLSGSSRNVALWAHQSVLEQLPSLLSLMNKLKDIEGDPSSAEVASRVKTTHVTEYSLESYCCLICYLYGGMIQLTVDLDDFAIGTPPNRPLSPSCRDRPAIDGLFSFTLSGTREVHSNKTTHSLPSTTWEELFQIADCYRATELREYCREKIEETLDVSNALDVLFRYAYRYPDLKETALKHVADNLTEMYSKSKDPFAAYTEHPQRHELMSEALHLMFKAKAQI